MEPTEYQAVAQLQSSVNRLVCLGLLLHTWSAFRWCGHSASAEHVPLDLTYISGLLSHTASSSVLNALWFDGDNKLCVEHLTGRLVFCIDEISFVTQAGPFNMAVSCHPGCSGFYFVMIIIITISQRNHITSLE